MPLSKTEWEAKKLEWKNRCAICGTTEKKLGDIDQAHLKARSKGGSQIVPLCPNCHRRYDRGLLNLMELRKIGIADKATYERMRPRKPVKKSEFPW